MYLIRITKEVKKISRNKSFFLYHPHLGKVNQTLLSEVGCALLNESQVSEVHTQVRDTWRVTAANTHTKHSELDLCKAIYF